MGTVLQAEQAAPATLIRTQPTADFCDENPSALVLQNGFISCGGSSACVGSVETICTRDDNSLVKATLREPGVGRVLLIDNQGSMTCAMLGGDLAGLAADNGWAGIVVNGAVRDLEELRQTPVGIFALATCPRKSQKRGIGTRGEPVRIGGTYIRRDDIIAADADGVVFLAPYAAQSHGIR
jgi:regulator of ribonuclease activity A